MTDDDDLLARATRALKERDAAAPPRPSPATRLAILDASDSERRRRRRNGYLVMPIAATFVLIATWAAASGKLGRAFATDAPEETAPVPAKLAPSSLSSAEPSAASADAPAMPASAPAADPAAAPSAPASVVTAHAPAARPAQAATIASGASSAASERADALYATAHRLHFDARDHEGALRAWDAYLADAPAGRLAPEARYNRGLCLVHLGRVAEARAALAPIAEGSAGSYRQDEAARLLRALDDAAP